MDEVATAGVFPRAMRVGICARDGVGHRAGVLADRVVRTASPAEGADHPVFVVEDEFLVAMDIELPRQAPTPYGQLILAILEGDTRLSARAEEAGSVWRSSKINSKFSMQHSK